MNPTPEIEAQGLKAYEQARAFERLRSWRLPLSFVIFSLLPLMSGLWLWRMGYPTLASLDCLGAVFLAAAGWFHWRRLCASYAKNLELLAELKAKFGDRLPWIQVENHFAALHQLQRELAENRNAGDQGPFK
jgi:hypothetical protein